MLTLFEELMRNAGKSFFAKKVIAGRIFLDNQLQNTAFLYCGREQVQGAFRSNQNVVRKL